MPTASCFTQRFWLHIPLHALLAYDDVMMLSKCVSIQTKADEQGFHNYCNVHNMLYKVILNFTDSACL